MKVLISLINDLISILCDASYVAQKKNKKTKTGRADFFWFLKVCNFHVCFVQLQQHHQTRRKLFEISHSLRSMMYGQDRYRRRYWVLPHCGGVFIEAMESGEGCCSTPPTFFFSEYVHASLCLSERIFGK